MTAPINKLILGFSKEIARPKGSWVWIDDKVVEHPKLRAFEPLKNHFNPLKDISYKKAREISEVLYTIAVARREHADREERKASSPEDTPKAKRLDEVTGDEEVRGMMDDLLVSPVLKRVLCCDGNEFSFGGPNTKISARIDRAELGEFDSLVLGLLLMAHYKGQVIVPPLISTDATRTSALSVRSASLPA